MRWSRQRASDFGSDFSITRTRSLDVLRRWNYPRVIESVLRLTAKQRGILIYVFLFVYSASGHARANRWPWSMVCWRNWNHSTWPPNLLVKCSQYHWRCLGLLRNSFVKPRKHLSLYLMLRDLLGHMTFVNSPRIQAHLLPNLVWLHHVV